MNAASAPWPARELPLPLADDEVHVWAVSLAAQPREVETLAQRLADDERRRAERFRLPHVRRRFVVARASLRALLAAYLPGADPPIELAYTALGKPFLARRPAGGLRFNLSHSGELALVALARGVELGVDVEQVRALGDQQGLAERFFAAEEVAALAALPEPQRLAAFFRCWTRKEAVLKALGSGLSFPLDRFAVSVADEPAPRVLSMDGQTAPAARWSLVHLAPEPGYVGAVALKAAARSVVACRFGAGRSVS